METDSIEFFALLTFSQLFNNLNTLKRLIINYNSLKISVDFHLGLV